MKPEEFEVYVIPPNFMEGGTLFGGLLKTRNTIEAVILGLAVGVPVLHLPFSLTVRVVILCLTALPLVLLALIGVSGMSLSAFIRLFFCFLHNRRILSRDGTQGGKNGKTLLPSWAQQKKSDCEAEDPPLPKSRSRFSVDLKQRSVTQFKTFLQEEEAVQPLNALTDYIPIEKIEHGVIYTRDHRYVKVVEVVPVNFLLRSAREQRSIIYSFISYLKIAPVKVQFKALTKRADINRHLDKITYADGSYVDAEGGTLSSTGLYWTDKEGKITISGISGTIVATEVKSIPGYTIDENTRTQTVVVNPNDTQTLHFYNTPIGGVEIIKVNEDNHSERIPNTTFEIRKVDDALVDTVTTDKNGRVFVALEDGSYYAKEVTSNKSFRLDDTPHYFEIKDGKRVTLQVTNKKLSGIVIHKIDSATGEGIYGVKFVLYDANKKPIGEYTSDDEGYIYIDEIPGGLSGRFYLRELEAAPGYTLDKQYKTVYVSPGKTVEIEWENTAVTGQIQIYKYAAEYNEVTGTAAGTPLKGAVYEIVNARSGKVVDYITTDARGVAASKPLPLTRYQIREVTAPAYWQLDPTVHDVTLEYPGQIIKLSAYDKPASLGVTITKRGNAQVMAGQSMRYDLTVANTSNVPLESFFWHDKIPYDVARPTTLTTGTYSARLNYRILYKTNCNASYQVLASNLLTSNNYSFSLNAIPMQAGEVVTDIYFDFGKVPVGFQSVVNPTLSVMVNGNAVNGYQMVNRADVGGKYQGTWQTATASWVTIIRRLWNTPTLPKTGY